ncbi:MAG: hypothetical protein Q8P93_02370 [bacterium]|nr:hypothetical protein [bacterium]
MKDHDTTMRYKAERDWMILLITTLVIILCVVVGSFMVRRAVRKDTAPARDALMLFFEADEVYSALDAYNERALRFELLRSAPPSLVDPAR